MSYNYEIDNNMPRKKNEQTKYTYKQNEVDSQIYIFELILKDINNNISIIRRIKKCNQGSLISINDNIKYNTINKYKLSVLDINHPDKPIIIKSTIDNLLTTNTYLSDKIYLEIIETKNNMLEFNYHITH